MSIPKSISSFLEKTAVTRSAFAYAAFFLSGASSLIFQNIWSRMLHHVFGSTSIAVSTVVTLFMAGLGLGAWLGGRIADRIKHPLIAYAYAELLVGTWALLVPLMVSSEGWLATVNHYLRTSFGAESFGFMIARFAVVIPILLVPTTLMGTTLPLLSRHFVQREERARTVASRVGALYAVNTLGAVVGIILAAFVLMPTVGLAWTNRVALSMNFALGLGILAARRWVLEGTWRPGERLDWWPRRDASERPTKPTAQGAGSNEGVRAHEQDDDDSSMPIPKIARWAAFVTFAASGAAALCYEVVWTRALSMTIGSSIFSFALILATFLVGIAGGSALCSALIGQGRRKLLVVVTASLVLLLIANAGWAIEQDLMTYAVLCLLFAAPIVVVWVAVEARSRQQSDVAAGEPVIPALIVLAVPVVAAVLNALLLATSDAVDAASGRRYLPIIAAAVVVLIALTLATVFLLRRFPVLLAGVLQLLIAIAACASYAFQDEIPYAFAHMVTTLESLQDHVGTVQFFMFFTAGLCVLPATLGMGAMFPLTLRIWSQGTDKVGEDVGTVYAGNTVGSIVGAWLPGFVLVPWIGMERTLILGMALNLALALTMLIASAADSPRPTDADGKVPARAEVPAWHAGLVYTLAPLIPALAALLYLGGWHPGSRWAVLSWNKAQMTLGVFRVSLAPDVLNPEAWGEPDLLYYHDGLATTVSVERWGRHFALKNNGKVDASNGDDMPTQIMVAGYPLLMHSRGPANLDVAVIGFGSGVTLGTALEFPVRSVDVIELERAIPQASRFFRDVNHLEYPEGADFPFVERDRLTVINDDGRNYLASTDAQYDIIMSEPSNPWITGVSDLFTTDHFRITKRRLREGGIYCQWVQLYELSPENIKTIYRTFASQFRYVVVFSAEDMSSDTVMLGSDSPLTLDANRIAAAYALPGVAAELERAYVHSPFDVLARTLLASRSEVLEYTQIEYRRRGSAWIANPNASNGGTSDCGPPNCRLEPAPLNTDDNALIEFSAPRDLIGFERYEGYLTQLYSPEWPYGRLLHVVQGFGEGDTASRNYAELALALLGHGKQTEAGECLAHALDVGSSSTAVIAAQVHRLLLTDDGEPVVAIEEPVPGPEMDAETADRLVRGFHAVREAVDSHDFGAARAAMEDIPSPLRMHSGAAMRFLYAYLLYKAADGDQSRIRAAIDQFEELARTDAEYVDRHPELYYFLARAHDAELNFDKALRNMRAYVQVRLDETAPTPGPAAATAPEPPPGEAVAVPAP